MVIKCTNVHTLALSSGLHTSARIMNSYAAAQTRQQKDKSRQITRWWHTYIYCTVRWLYPYSKKINFTGNFNVLVIPAHKMRKYQFSLGVSHLNLNRKLSFVRYNTKYLWHKHSFFLRFVTININKRNIPCATITFIRYDGMAYFLTNINDDNDKG